MKKSAYSYLGFALFPLFLPLIRIYLRRSHRVYVALCYQGQVLLIKNWLSRDTWRFPGGGVDRGETVRSAAVREIKEELRIVISEAKLVHVSSGVLVADDLKCTYDLFRYDLSIYPKVLPNRLEIVDHGLFSKIPTKMHPDFREAVEVITADK
jgi:8-oxo-dGTP diphosphatase